MSDDSIAWQPGARLEHLRLRATMLANVRLFFAQRSVLEVETPVLSRCTSVDPNLHSLETQIAGISTPMYLQTSPEFHMKRLIASGSGDIYQISRVFRNGEAGTQHNPEFTMIEWYRLGIPYLDLADEVCLLIADLLNDPDYSKPIRMSYAQALRDFAGIDQGPDGHEELAGALQRSGIDVPRDLDLASMQDLVFSTKVIPTLACDRCTVIYDFPAQQAALARLRDDDPTLAQRFEVFAGGLELANGFQELDDADQQRERFDREQRTRTASRAEEYEIDERLIAALKHGLPECSGVALGFDRLVMLASGVQNIGEAMAFDLERA